MSDIRNRPASVFMILWLCCAGTGRAAEMPPLSDQIKAWQAAVLEAQTQLASLDPESEAFTAAAGEFSIRGEREFPIVWDWCLQDAGTDFGRWLSASMVAAVARNATANALAPLGAAGGQLQSEYDRLVSQSSPVEAKQWLGLYVRVAEVRRDKRLQSLRRKYPQWIFTKHCILGGSHYAYTEGQSDAQHERQWEPGAALCRLELEGTQVGTRTLIADDDGVIRDPDVSWDGRSILFSWKKSDREDDYHLYEMNAADGAVKQLTEGLGFADYEGVYLPNDDILFNSTRCVQTVDCWWTEVSNLYTCSRDGRHLRRLSFDQVHDNYPMVMPDGRIVYTRWEYQDRGQLFVQGLFQMNPDGTSQTEFYANDSWFPTSLLHARGIPGTQKIIAVVSGHHTRQVGKLGIVDPARGRQENSGTTLIAPVRETPAERIDYYGQDGELFQYPYPLSESEFVVAYTPFGWSRSPTLFKLYWVDANGRRELLATDPDLSCGQPVPLAARPRPFVRPNIVDYGKTSGTCYVQDIYTGPGLEGIARGTVKKLRVIGLDYRAAGVGWNYNKGPAGDALACTPVAIGNGSWDVKVVLGDATVYEDGSVFFTVPSRMPIYFQAIDARGYAVQTMRSWATLQPGENASCAGCHEPKNSTPNAGPRPSLAFNAGAEDLVPLHGPSRPFSFAREIQPILDRHCIRCHDDNAPAPHRAAPCLLGTPAVENLARRQWTVSYLALVQATEQTLENNRYLAGTTDGMVNWVGAQSTPPMLAPYEAGAARSRLLALLAAGHYDVKLSPQDMDRLACWIDLQVPFCGDYQEANTWNDEERQKYAHFLDKRRRMEDTERRNIAEWSRAQTVGLTAPSGDEEKKKQDGGTSPALQSPVALAASREGNELYVATATGEQVLVVDRTTGAVSRKFLLPDSPSGIAISADGKSLYVTAGLPQGCVLVLNAQTGDVQGLIPAGFGPTSPVLSKDGKTLFVCDPHRSRLLAIDLASEMIRSEVSVGREPVAAACTPDGKLVLVSCLLPAGPATAETVAAELVAVNAADLTIAGRITLPNGSTSARGVCVSPDGRYAYVVHTLAHYQLPTTQVDRGWMNTSAMSVIDVAGLRRINTVLLDDVDLGAANPWDVTCTGDGKWLCVSHAGTHEVSIIDRPGLHRKLGDASKDVSSDLTFLGDLRRRVRLPGNGPRGIAVAGQTLYAAERFSDSVAAVELSAETKDRVKLIPLGPAPQLTEAQRGEMFFHDADMCFQRWQSCASCHPDARADGLNWDLLNDGLGSPRNTKSMVWAHRTPPMMSLGVRETAEMAVRAGIRHIQFVVRPEADAAAIDAYLKSLKPLPSPYAADKQLAAKVEDGQRLFARAGCRDCHLLPLYTSLKAFDVGTGTGQEAGRAFDTPTLVELWRTAPYLHDGRAATLEDVFTKFNADNRHGNTSSLSPSELEDLIAYLLSL